MKAFMFTIILFYISNAYAWNKVGNGGDVLICHEGTKRESVKLLDAYEGSELYGLPIQINDKIKNDVDLSLDLINRMKEVAPARFQMLSTYAQNFYQEVKFVNWDLEDIPDHGFLKIPQGCKIKQLIVNSCNSDSDSFFDFPHNQAPLIKKENLEKWHQICKGRYKIDRRYWDKLDYIQRALAITHESFMRDYRHMGDPDFNFDGPFHPVRYLNILLFSNKISLYNFKKFQQLYQSIGRVEQVREDDFGYIELKRSINGPKRLLKIVNGQQFWETAVLITAVPQIDLSVISYMYGMGEIIPVKLSSSDFYFFNDEINFVTNSQIEILKNNYSNERIKVTGKIRAKKQIEANHPFTIEYIFDYDTVGSEFIRTGFSTPEYCHYDDIESEMPRLDFLVSYTNYTERSDENLKTITYKTLDGFRVENSFLNIYINSNEQIIEIRPHYTNCTEEGSIAKSIVTKASGLVKIKNNWVKITNQSIFIDLVKKEIEVY